MQVCHGKVAPLRRIHSGDGVVYYSPPEQFGGSQVLRAFTAIGVVAEGMPYALNGRRLLPVPARCALAAGK